MSSISTDTIVGIDLGTTNSEIAAFVDDRVRVLGRRGNNLLPSVVGLSPEGKILVGEEALNQALLYPERTIRSVKRKMGTNEIIVLGEQHFSPSEVSALILSTLVDSAEAVLGCRPTRAVITVPAYFNDAQRHATREAGKLAGLEVLRIINEPTAASLAYGESGEGPRVVMVYDLGGGTFDVSLVRIEGDVTEVLASHGNNHLGGDDFTQKLADHLRARFEMNHGVDLAAYPVGLSRLWWASETAKKELSSSPYAKIREENLINKDGIHLHLEEEVSREEYEDLIRPLLETTYSCVTQTMTDAGITNSGIDSILLVGGVTRTPLIVEELKNRSGKTPSSAVHPDLCVALGAGVMASRLAGHEVDRVLVDVSPYSFGIKHEGERGGYRYMHCYKPTICRNTPLPVTRTERYYTARPDQDRVLIEVFQGEDEDALRNIPIGDFYVEGLAKKNLPDWENGNEILVKMALNLNGILQVSVTEKSSGLSKHITIENSFADKSEEEIQSARARLNSLYSRSSIDEDEISLGEDDYDSLSLSDADYDEPEEAEIESASPLSAEAETLLERSRGMLERMHEEDREEAVDLHEEILNAKKCGEEVRLKKAMDELREILFYVDAE